MKISEIHDGRIRDIAVRSLSKDGLNQFQPFELLDIHKAGDGLLALSAVDRRTVVAPVGRDASEFFEESLNQSAQISALSGHDGASGVLRVWTSARGFNLGDNVITIQLEQNVLEAIATLNGSAVDDELVQGWLRDQFVLPEVGTTSARIFLRIDKSSELFSDAFVLIGATRELDVQVREKHLIATRLTPRRLESVLTTVLVKTRLRFVTDLTDVSIDEAPLGALLKNDRYLRQWALYRDAELADDIERSEHIGSASYVDVEALESGVWRFKIAGETELLNRANEEHTLEAQGADEDLGRNVRGGKFFGTVVRLDEHNRQVDLRATDPNNEPPRVGRLIYSLGGSEMIHLRREIAAQKLATGNVPLPELSRILEGESTNPRRVVRRLGWDSPATRLVFAGMEPTDAQKLAIEISLNTPDIAVIQGPPGTGKTQVIAAIAARVAEELGNVAAPRQILLSSFQHEAVDNVAARTLVFGLPTLKETRNDSGGSWISGWRQDVLHGASELFSKIEQGELALKLGKIIEQRKGYILAPTSDDSAADLLEDLVLGLSKELSARVAEQIKGNVTALRRAKQTSEKSLNLVSAVRGIRTTKIAHEDDGNRNASRVLARLDSDSTSTIDIEILKLAQANIELSSEQFKDLEEFKNDLLDKFGVSSVRTMLPSKNEKVIQSLNAIITDLDGVLKFDGKGLALVLSRFITDLETDSHGIGDALAKYAAVIAATCQRAGSLAVRPDQDGTDLTFDTVIVDEAARANPLDLQIPMSIASRRIVLVGDQRQLPHIVDATIIGKLDSGSVELDELSESLFSRLFKFLESERRLGRPQRTVTLNKQFRMHPRLGKFISENFYEQHGQVIESPRPASDFTHSLPGYEGRIAEWVDVPPRMGKAEKVGKSWIREVEADRIAIELERLLEAAPHLSFGVITFYRAQADLILEHLYARGIADIDPNSGQIEISSDQWKYTTNDKGETIDRVRVDTVDGFQGREFDVTLLSTVRSPLKFIESPSRAFGHLVIMNRLCVALSRQRRLLIVVGDKSGITESSLSEEHVAPLCAFARLCDEEI